MGTMRPLVIAAVLLLSGCWEGPLFYSASDAVQPLEPGRYEFSSPDEAPALVSVTVDADGMTRIADDRFGFVPSDRAGGTYIMWDEPEEAGEQAEVQYLVLQRRSEREYAMYSPQCEGEERRIALAAGARLIEDRNVNRCHFPTRESLQEAVRNWRPQAGQGARMVRIDDGPR